MHSARVLCEESGLHCVCCCSYEEGHGYQSTVSLHSCTAHVYVAGAQQGRPGRARRRRHAAELEALVRRQQAGGGCMLCTGLSAGAGIALILEGVQQLSLQHTLCLALCSSGSLPV